MPELIDRLSKGNCYAIGCTIGLVCGFLVGFLAGIMYAYK